MNPPLVSVITPTLNRRELLARTLRSVAEQTYPNVEHIVVDGGSTDGSVELLQGHDVRWISERDHGMYAAINKGMSMASGQILAYLNSDDLYFPWTVDSAVSALLENPQVDVVYGDLAHLDTETGRGGLRLYPPFHLGYLVRSAFIGQPTAFWRRRVLTKLGGFDENLRFVADCDFWMRAGSHFRFLKLDEVLAVDGGHPATLRVTNSEEVVAELRAVRRKHGSEAGLKGLALRAFDMAYFAIHTEMAFLGLIANFVRARVLGRRPRRWRRLLESTVRLSLAQLLLCLIPGRRRWLGTRAVTLLPNQGHTSSQARP